MSIQSNGRNRSAAVDIKGSTVTLPIVRLLADDMAAIISQLKQKIQKAPDFFRGAPVVVDVSALAEPAKLDLKALLAELRQLELILVGMKGGDDALREQAASLQLACLADTALPEARSARPVTPPPQAKPASPPPTPENEAPAPPSHAMVITQPVRSGQRVYAKGSDLIVLAPVGYGAEIMADGHIHIYSTLRGRALAGVHGDTECRIFCRDLQAELVSIAGHYRISEDLDEEVRGRPVQIYMNGTSLIIEAL